jgi:superfamily I DNA/RNA helicase/RecB family exonuclease
MNGSGDLPTPTAASALPQPDAPAAALAARLPDGNLVLLGGPGSGKTALLEASVHHLLAQPGGSVLYLTSSRPAAVAATERLLDGLAAGAAAGSGPRAAGSSLGCVTWYAFARGLVTGHADLLPYRGEPRLLSGPEQWSQVRALLLEDAGGEQPVDWGELVPLIGTRAFTDELAELILACERRLLSPDDLAALAAERRQPAWLPVAAFYRRYLELLALNDSVDQAGLIVQAGDLLEDHPEVLATLVARVGTVLADEAQELDRSQLRLLDLLAGAGARVILAGDPAGTTDEFRGATPGTLPGLAARFGARTILLDRSHRLGGQVLDAIHRLQAAGPERGVVMHGGGTTQVQVAGYPSQADEADAVARQLLLAHQRDGVPYGRMAVLLPSLRRAGGPIRRALERYGVPYRLAAGERQLVAEPIVRHLLDLFRLALDPDRADELLASLLTSPLGGLDPRELRALRRAAVLADRSLPDHVACATADADALGVTEPIATRVRAFCELLERTRRWVQELEADRCFWEVWRHAPAFAELVDRAARDAGLQQGPAAGPPAGAAGSARGLALEPPGALPDPATARQLDALTAFSRALALFVDGRPNATMRTYLDVVERADFASDPWLPPSMARADAVSLLSVNAAKGREFDVVVVAGCVEGALPRTAWPQGLFEAWRLDGDQDPVSHARAILDAERRRFVLAASRARDRVVFTYAKVDGRGEPSRFLAAFRPAGDDAGVPAVPDDAPLGPLEAAGALRRIAGDQARPAAERLAAVATLAAMPASSAATNPATWWWQRDWTNDPEPIASDGRLRTSYSRIGTYEDCHLRYFYSSVAGLDDRTSYQMAFGKLMHTIFELAAKGEIGGDPASLKAAYRERFDRAWFPTRAVAQQYWRDGMAMLELWHGGEAELARRALAFEVPFEMEVGGHVVRGRIDRVDPAEAGGSGGLTSEAQATASGDPGLPGGSPPVQRGVALLDYKTARTPATEEEARRSLQLAIYYLAALRDPELAALGVPVEMQLVYPAQARQGRFARVRQRPGPDHAAAVERRLLALLDGAAAERFDPNPHADCHFCAFKTICPMWPQGEDFLAPVVPPAGLDPHGGLP